MTVEEPADGWKHEAALLTPDGETVDITGELAVLFDLVVSSMDWGSGFLDREDEDVVMKIGILAGFQVPECATGYIGDANWFAACTLPRNHDGNHRGPEIKSHWTREIAPGTGIFGANPAGDARRQLVRTLGEMKEWTIDNQEVQQ